MRGRAGLAGEPPGRGAAGPSTGEGPLTDQEYLWEPAPGAWSLRPGHEPRPLGPGEWLLDDAPGDPDPTPVTTIAWRLGHLHLDFAGNWEWTFGGRHQPPEQLVDFSPSAAVGAGAVWATMDRWRDSVAALTCPVPELWRRIIACAAIAWPSRGPVQGCGRGSSGRCGPVRCCSSGDSAQGRAAARSAWGSDSEQRRASSTPPGWSAGPVRHSRSSVACRRG
jgi:hypothetical protein